MKIRSVKANNHRKCFELRMSGRALDFPYACLEARPSTGNPVAGVYIDDELGREGFTYTLANGDEDTVHSDHVLFYNRDPEYLKRDLLHKLTVEAIRCHQESRLSKRELVRRLGTSASQLYRLLDPTNYRKSIDQMMALLAVLGRTVELSFKDQDPRRSSSGGSKVTGVFFLAPTKGDSVKTPVMSRESSSAWFVYIVQCSDASLYTGITTDVERRLLRHNQGVGARYTRSRLPVRAGLQ